MYDEGHVRDPMHGNSNTLMCKLFAQQRLELINDLDRLSLVLIYMEMMKHRPWILLELNLDQIIILKACDLKL